MPLITQVSLLVLGVFGYISLLRFGDTNGFFRLLEAAIANGVYAHDSVPVTALNDGFNFFIAFFWPCVDGENPGLSLACYVFAGQWIAGWALITMEGYRAGNKGRVISL